MPDCELFEGRYGEPPPFEKARERSVYILDFSYPRDQLVKLHEYTDATGCLRVLDHHKTAEADLVGLDFCEFDMERSGAGMTWDYFFSLQRRPGWIDRVEDRDLWQFKFDDTREYHAFISSLPMTMTHWNSISGASAEAIRASGRTILRYINTRIDKAVQQARVVKINGDIVVTLNIPYQNASETGAKLLELHPEAVYSMTYYLDAHGYWRYSLRSRPGFDVSEIAKQYGGGGHAQASGFGYTELLSEIHTNE
jgi:nanoRNase/pAp phosphatase (c-di-AMP/oligoRNAs hydrolase)